MKLSIIIPCFNEEKCIGLVLRKLDEFSKSGAEILIIDDGSTDNTAGVASKNGGKVITHSTNRGKGISIREGIAFAKHEVILFLDGDGQDDPADIPKLYRAIEQGADFVIGSRWLGELRHGAISKLNFLVTGMLSTLISVLFKTNITDSQAGFRCVRKSKVKDFRLRAEGYDIETEMLIKAIKHKLRIVEVPVTRSKRLQGSTKMKRLQLGIKILSHMLRELLIHN
ncbi:MAG: glycosyltransferase family 2 protein [Candidatus Bathyarchaeota archaeon]|nr:MAG: glycosyltransferase family 2 protein [Candidatus Bathyarchaeota archaeon]